jgi:ABC-type branched-subunit amino acid transport system substrate-binding protein
VRRCLLALLVVPALAGCGHHAISTNVHGDVLTVYSSSALSGPESAVSRRIVDGEKLALSVHKGAVGALLVRFVSLDSAREAASGFTRRIVANNAQTAVDDSTAIAYLGETVPLATRVSLPILSAATVSVLSPSDPDPQLTAPLGAVPDGAYLRGVRTGFSLAPLSDAQILRLAGPAFAPAFRHAFGGRPDAATARGYVAMNLIIAAVTAAGVHGDDRAAIARALGPVVERALASARR